mmetsp:Transcript_17861/g.52148  ORF Transcript_17861/g.52148 Transcript_17861/m.52148 type:complete len:240 (-) Transcript_17861:1192-1911(-)
MMIRGSLRCFFVCSCAGPPLGPTASASWSVHHNDAIGLLVVMREQRVRSDESQFTAVGRVEGPTGDMERTSHCDGHIGRLQGVDESTRHRLAPAGTALRWDAPARVTREAEVVASGVVFRRGVDGAHVEEHKVPGFEVCSEPSAALAGFQVRRRHRGVPDPFVDARVKVRPRNQPKDPLAWWHILQGHPQSTADGRLGAIARATFAALWDCIPSCRGCDAQRRKVFRRLALILREQAAL